MLVVRQREGDILEIGPDVRILVKRVRGGAVRLCIDAPRDVEIRRLAGPEAEVLAEGPEVEAVVLRRHRKQGSSSQG